MYIYRYIYDEIFAILYYLFQNSLLPQIAELICFNISKNDCLFIYRMLLLFYSTVFSYAHALLINSN